MYICAQKVYVYNICFKKYIPSVFKLLSILTFCAESDRLSY
jgi:hypothetical protein